MSKARCNRCQDVIESTYRHDFKRCKCGTIFVDGGKDYMRYGFEKRSDITLLNDDGTEAKNDE